MKQLKAKPFLLWWGLTLLVGLGLAAQKRESAVKQALREQAFPQAVFAAEAGPLGTVDEIRACKQERLGALKREARLRGALRHMQATISRLRASQEVEEPLLVDLYKTAQAALAEEPPQQAAVAR